MAKTDEKFECTFKSCSKTFTSLSALKKHKEFDGEHEYCPRCDEDFDDFDALMLHKLDSPKHIACPICGDDFKSEGGRDIHVRTLHQADQSIKCVGCGTDFNRAHGLMRHIESNRCPGFNKVEYQAQRAQKRANKAVFDKLRGDTINDTETTAGSVAESDDGGVGINIMDSSEFPALGAMEERAPLQLKNHTAGRLSVTEDSPTASAAASNIKQWPTPTPRSNEFGGNDDNDLMAFSELGLNDQETYEEFERNENENEEVGPVDEWGECPPEPENENKRQTLTIWDTDRYWNPLLKLYVCSCDKSFRTSDDLTKHLNTGVHDAGVIYCPACFRPYKSTPALIAHLESGTSRCSASQSTNYAKIVDDVSGGVIDVRGEHFEGTVKLTAAPKMEIKPFNPDNVQW